MRDLTSERAIHVKAALFLVLGALSSVLLILDNPRASTVVLLAVSVWAFARAYYYAFYVIEHYVDDRFRYSGLGSFIRYLVQRRRSQRSDQ
ncbi:MAG: hypothetical protein DMG06_19380 [Acidobacteria bacterium]|nr:MAG: hypothetical protein DMG06_19380 [Acidobacteriota bacterium]